MNDALVEFRAWLTQKIRYHEGGEMQSLSESVEGASCTREVLEKFDELFPDVRADE